MTSKERILPTPIYLYGAGGFGREIAITIAAINQTSPTWRLVGFLDDHRTPGEVLNGVKILGGMEQIGQLAGHSGPVALAICVGNADVQRSIAEKIADLAPHIQFPNLIHPQSTLDMAASGLKVGVGNLIAAGARLTANVTMGSFNIINLNSVLAHDVQIGDRCQINPGAILNGGVILGDEAVVGAGAVILPRLRIGRGAVVTIGAVVGSDVMPDEVVAGNPARVVRRPVA